MTRPNVDAAASVTAAPAGRHRAAGGRARGLPGSARHRLLAAALGLVAIAGGGGAWAYWHSSGTGAGTATTGTVTAVTLTPGTPAAALHPGGQTNVTLTVSNPNTGTVTIGSLTLDTTQGVNGFTVDGAHSACATSTLTFTTQTNAGAGWTVPAQTGGVNGVLAVTLPDALAMTAAAADACQGAQFIVYLVAGS